MVVKQLLVILIITVSVKSEEYVEIHGVTQENPHRLTTVQIEATKNLKEDSTCQSMKTIEGIKGISIIPRNYFANLRNLKKIILQNINRIEPGAIRHVPKLKHIEITKSSWDEVDEGVFNELPVVHLSLTQCGIVQIAPTAFDDMPNLEEIDLSRNRLALWHSDWFSNTPHLIKLNFMDNRIGELPDGAFRNIKTESWIDLSNNRIRTVGRNLYDGTRTVWKLYLAHNKIEHFDKNALVGVEMEKLWISSNLIECFSGHLDDIFVARVTKFDGNPISCDCAKDISEWERESSARHVIYWDGMEKCGGRKRHLHRN